MDDAAIICDEVINADAKLSPRDDDETKTIQSVKPKIFIFYFQFF